MHLDKNLPWAFAISSEEDIYAVARYFGVEHLRGSRRELDLALHAGYVVWEPDCQGVFTRTQPPKDILWIDVEKLKEDLWENGEYIILEGKVSTLYHKYRGRCGIGKPTIHENVIEMVVETEMCPLHLSMGYYRITLEKVGQM